MGLDTAKVNTRAISDCLNVQMVVNDTDLDGPTRMEMVMLYADMYRNATQGSVGRVTAERQARRRFPLLWSIAERAGLR